ncbi:hypothetical protein ACU4GD_42995 [Cupriavidus basilensis]
MSDRQRAPRTCRAARRCRATRRAASVWSAGWPPSSRRPHQAQTRWAAPRRTGSAQAGRARSAARRGRAEARMLRVDPAPAGAVADFGAARLDRRAVARAGYPARATSGRHKRVQILALAVDRCRARGWRFPPSATITGGG